MMKKLCLILMLMVLPSVAKAQCFCQLLPEFKVSYYRFSDSVLRDIYDDGAVLYEGELNYRVYSCIQIFAGAGYLNVTGKSLGGHEGTRMRLVPISLGAKFTYPVWCNIDAYLGAGLRYFFLDIKNDSDYVRKHVSDNHPGGVVNAGLNWKCGCLVFNPFVEYSFCHFDFNRSKKDCEWNIKRHNINVDGWSFGAGVGYMF